MEFSQKKEIKGFASFGHKSLQPDYNGQLEIGDKVQVTQVGHVERDVVDMALFTLGLGISAPQQSYQNFVD